MDQITCINNAISAQANRVDAIRRALMPLPGKLHQVDMKTISDKATLRKRIEPAARALVNGQVATPDLIHNTTNVVTPIIKFTGNIAKAKKVSPSEANFDGITAGILRSKDITDVDHATAVIYSVETSLVETGLLSNDVTFINSNIIDLLLVAATAPTLGPEAIHYEDLIAPSGFCYLEKPLIVGDYHPETGEYQKDIHFGWRAFSWNTTSEGLNFMIYTDWGIYRHIYAPSVEAHDPDITDNLAQHSAWRDDDIFIVDIQRWDFGKVWDSRGIMPAEDQEKRLVEAHLGDGPIMVNPHVELFRKFFLSMMRFCWQELLVSERATVTRQVRRAAVRELGKDFTMNMLRLRRIKKASSSDSDTGEGEGARLDYRLVVRGHWKNQFYPSWGPCKLEDGTSNPESHRRIWVDPYVKGPEDAPFVRKHKITALVR